MTRSLTLGGSVAEQLRSGGWACVRRGADFPVWASDEAEAARTLRAWIPTTDFPADSLSRSQSQPGSSRPPFGAVAVEKAPPASAPTSAHVAVGEDRGTVAPESPLPQLGDSGATQIAVPEGGEVARRVGLAPAARQVTGTPAVTA